MNDLSPQQPDADELDDFWHPGRRTRSFIAILACVGVTGLGLGISLPLLSILMNRMAVPDTVIGLNAATAALATLICTPFVPYWLQRLGALRFLTLCMATAFVCLLAFKAFENIWAWFVLRFISGAALAGLFVVSEVWINQLATEKNRGQMIALYAATLSAGFAVGPALLTVTGTQGWAPFLAGAAIVALGALPLALARGVAPRIEGERSRSFRSMIFAAPAATLAAFVYGAAELGLFNFLAIYAVRTGHDEDYAPLLLSAVAAGNILCQYPIGWLADRFRRSAVLAGCGIAGLAGALLLPFAIHNLYVLYPLLFLWGGVVVGLYTVGLTMLGQRFRGPDLAAANAAYIMMYGMGTLVGPPLTGLGMDLWNPHGLAAVLAAIFALYLLVTVLARRRLTSPRG